MANPAKESIRPFRLEIRLHDRLIGSHLIDDPFHRTTIVVGWQDLLRALLRRSLRLRVGLYGAHWLVESRTMQAIQSWHDESWPELPPARPGDVFNQELLRGEQR